MHIAIIGGTGKEGRGLALRWARAGHEVTLGSRDAERAAACARDLAAAHTGRLLVRGDDNAAAARAAGVVVLCIPYAAHAATLQTLRESLAGRILVDLTVPLQPPRVAEVTLPAGQAAALEAQALLGTATPVVAALHHVSSAHLADLEHQVECDVLVCADAVEAKQVVLGLVQDLGLHALDAGPLRNAIALEALTPVLIYLNKKYKSRGTGLRITGLPG
jgi:NADPH-dependent F420 reductase